MYEKEKDDVAMEELMMDSEVLKKITCYIFKCGVK